MKRVLIKRGKIKATSFRSSPSTKKILRGIVSKGYTW